MVEHLEEEVSDAVIGGMTEQEARELAFGEDSVGGNTLKIMMWNLI